MPCAARADDAPNESEATIQRGVELRRAGRNAEALVEFQKAFTLDPSPRARAQVALALQALGDWLGAEHWLLDALQRSDDAWIARYRTDLAGALATVQAHLGSLRLHVDAEQGEVLVNGAPAGALPSRGPDSRRRRLGRCGATRAGHVDAHRVIDVAAGAEVSRRWRSVRERRRLRRRGGAATVADVSPATRSHVDGYVAFGSAGLLAIGGVAAGWSARMRSARGTTTRDASSLAAARASSSAATYQDTANVALGWRLAPSRCPPWAPAWGSGCCGPLEPVDPLRHVVRSGRDRHVCRGVEVGVLTADRRDPSHRGTGLVVAAAGMGVACCSLKSASDVAEGSSGKRGRGPMPESTGPRRARGCCADSAADSATTPGRDARLFAPAAPTITEFAVTSTLRRGGHRHRAGSRRQHVVFPERSVRIRQRQHGQRPRANQPGRLVADVLRPSPRPAPVPRISSWVPTGTSGSPSFGGQGRSHRSGRHGGGRIRAAGER